MTEINLSEKEKTIIEAARKRFAHFGFSKVTMEEIAVDVDMGKASLYYYFPTKESIFKQVISQEQDELANEIESIIHKDITSAEKLIQYVKVRHSFFQKLVNLGTLSVHSLTDTKSIYKKLFTEFEVRELALIKNMIDEGIKKGEFKKDLEKETPSVILHILQGLRFRVLKQSRELERDEKLIKELQKEMDLAIKIVLNGILK